MWDSVDANISEASSAIIFRVEDGCSKFSELLIPLYQTTQWHIQKTVILNNMCFKNNLQNTCLCNAMQPYM
jgi:hypothetical protein